MAGFNPHDAVNQIIRRSKKVDKALQASIEVAQKFDLVPRAEPLRFFVFVDERLTPVYVSEQIHPVEFNRRGKWIQVIEG